MNTTIQNGRAAAIGSRIRRVTFAALALFALAGCESGTTEPANSPALLLRNEANVPIVSVNIASCSDQSWGPNKLNANETIPPGGLRSWRLTPGCWDVRASTEAKSGSWFDRFVSEGDTLRLALSAAADS